MRRHIILAMGMLLVPASIAANTPRPRRGFALLSAPLGLMAVNRVSCGLSNSGEICTDAQGRSTIGGGFWPKGTLNQYFFNSGPQIAGIIGPDGGPWAGDTTGAFFFDPKGNTQHGRGISDIYNAAIPADLAKWPVAARVPDGPGSFYHASLQTLSSASQGDVWWLMWEGDTTLLAVRPHPLGVLAEVRGLGWTYPVGNEDICISGSRSTTSLHWTRRTTRGFVQVFGQF